MTKKPYLQYTRSAVEIDYMRAMKAVFDPKNVMNPGKIIDA
jgi:FAD/FMN-containing dehydrogenase